MSYFTPLGEDTGVRRIVACNPAAGRALIDADITALGNGSGLPSADKECIAACVSGLNACHYCYGVHTETAKGLGVEEGLIAQLLVDVDTTPEQYKLCPLLVYARKLSLESARITQIDADSVSAAGWG